MLMSSTLSFRVEDILTWHAIMSKRFAVSLIVIGRRNGSSSQIVMQLSATRINAPCLNGESAASMDLTWGNAFDDDCARDEASVGQTRLVEDAAVGVAAILFPNVVNARFMNVVQIGDKVDYMLMHEDGQFALEVSGSEAKSGLTSLHKRKRKQLLGNEMGKDGYVVVCGFKEKKVMFSFHRYGEETPAS